MIEIYLKELEFISDLSKRSYTGNTMDSNSSVEERIEFRSFKKKLKSLAEYFKNQFNDEFGEFTFNASSGNPIKFNGTKLNRVWSGIFKGAQNKQYSAQISFVVNEQNKSIDLGFYFGGHLVAHYHFFTVSTSSSATTICEPGNDPIIIITT
ncbi:MAG: hypothetical protein HYZ42_10470 [Bacteroidetes bacterium]|nr:hypothetical protein [Bacteroidota bacterium]